MFSIIIWQSSPFLFLAMAFFYQILNQGNSDDQVSSQSASTVYQISSVQLQINFSVFLLLSDFLFHILGFI